MNRVRLSVRSLAVTVVGLMAAATLIVPASAHVNSPLTFGHLKRHFYTKGQSNARFIDTNEISRFAPRVGYAINNADTVPTNASPTLVSATITAPAAGFLVLHGSSDAYQQNGVETVTCLLRLNATDLESATQIIRLDWDTGQANDGGGDTEANFNVNFEENCSPHTVVPVPAGTHTVALRVFNGTNLNDTNYDNSVVSALWVPFGATGAAPTSFGLLGANKAAGSGADRAVKVDRG